MIYAGLDPGKKGALAVIYEDGRVEVSPLGGIMLQVILMALGKAKVRMCLERVHSMPKQGVASTFTFGMNYGYIKGLLDAYGVSYQEVPPERWKKEFNLSTDKKRSIEVAHQLFPGIDLRPTERSRVDNDGMAEALLMAEYARRKL